MKKYSVAFEKDGRRVQGSFLLLGCFCFGPVWLVCQAMWMPALIYLLITLFTVGGAWLIMPFFATALARKWYVSQGWKEAEVIESPKKYTDPDDHSGLIFAGLGVMTLICLGFIAFLSMV